MLAGKNNKDNLGNFSDLLNYRLLFGENGSIKKNVSWIKVMKGLEGQSRTVCITDKTSGWLIFSSRYLALSHNLTWNFQVKKKKIRKHNPWIKVKAYLNLISDFGIFPPRGTVLLLSPDIWNKKRASLRKLILTKHQKNQMVYNMKWAYSSYCWYNFMGINILNGP